MDAFNSFSFSHTRILYNSIAYNLAKYARYVNSSSMWIEDVLLHLADILLADYD